MAMTNNTVIVFGLFFVALLVSTNAQAIVYESTNPPERVKSDSKTAEVFEYEGMTFYSIPNDRVQYYVTNPGHPAFPYIVEVRILGRGVDTRFEATGYGREADSQAAAEFLQKVNDANAAKVEKLKALQGADAN